MSKIVQSGESIFGPPNEFISPDVFDPTKGLMALVSSIAKESKNMGAKKLNKDIFVDAGLNLISKKIKKRISPITGSGMTLTSNEIKYKKVIKSLENRGILLKGTTRKITSQEGGFLNFLRRLMTAGLPLAKKVLIPLAKSVLIQLGLSAGMSAADAAIQIRLSFGLSFAYKSTNSFK